jgi:glycosyltransferase involved in cell wall biosynthesis
MKNFVIIIPSYNNKRWYDKNLYSALGQSYKNFRVIYIDDCSKDGTEDLVKEFLEAHDPHRRVEFVRNDENLGAMRNIYNSVHSCKDNEICLTLDGDDWLAHPHVLKRLNDIYEDGDVWMTYGSYQDFPYNSRGCCKPYEKHIIESNMFRKVPWRASHLRTFYKWLFAKIRKEDLYDSSGKWMDAAWDLPMMFPMLEMSGYHHKYVNDILYCYNNENPISDCKIKLGRQASLDRLVRSRPAYARLEG